MKTILILLEKPNPRVDYLTSIIKDQYDVVCFTDVDESIKYVMNNYDNLFANVVDNPSHNKEINKVVEFDKAHKGSLLAVPVIVLTDSENVSKDEGFLDSMAIAVINTSSDSPKLISTRIKRAYDAVNSRGFQEFSNMLAALPSLIYVKDSRGKYIFCSQAWHHVYNHHDGIHSIIGLTDFDIRKDKENARIAHENDLKVIETGKGVSYLVKEEDEEGTDYLRIIKEPLKREDGSVKGVIAIVNNVTEQEMLRQELRMKSITDPLTGLYNRQYFDEVAQMMKGDISNFPITVLSGDCDNLKKINDKFGHHNGDRYIQMTADLIRSVVPDDSVIFRMGGDEFLTIIPHMGIRKANALIRQIEKNMKSFKTEKFSLKVSFGTHTVSKPCESVDKCIIASDRAMYRNKHKREKKKRGSK